MTRATPDEFRIPTASELQELRLIVGLTQQEVADELGISRTTISHWEGGVQSPSLDQARDLIAVYATHFDEQDILWRSPSDDAPTGIGDEGTRGFGAILELFGLPSDLDVISEATSEPTENGHADE